jgi:hypothetical protein
MTMDGPTADEGEGLDLVVNYVTKGGTQTLPNNFNLGHANFIVSLLLLLTLFRTKACTYNRGCIAHKYLQGAYNRLLHEFTFFSHRSRKICSISAF